MIGTTSASTRTSSVVSSSISSERPRSSSAACSSGSKASSAVAVVSRCSCSVQGQISDFTLDQRCRIVDSARRMVAVACVLPETIVALIPGGVIGGGPSSPALRSVGRSVLIAVFTVAASSAARAVDGASGFSPPQRGCRSRSAEASSDASCSRRNRVAFEGRHFRPASRADRVWTDRCSGINFTGSAWSASSSVTIAKQDQRLFERPCPRYARKVTTATTSGRRTRKFHFSSGIQRLELAVEIGNRSQTSG